MVFITRNFTLCYVQVMYRLCKCYVVMHILCIVHFNYEWIRKMVIMIMLYYEQIIICDDELCSYYCFNFMVMTIFSACIHCYVQVMSFCSGLCSSYEMYSLPLIHKSERINRLFNPQDHLEQGGAFWRPQRAGAGTPWRRLSRRASGARSRWGGSGRKWRRENCQWYRRRGGRADSCK